LELVEATVDSLPKDHLLFPISVGMGALSADQLLFSERAEKLAAVLKSRPEWEEHDATLKYFRAIAKNVLSKASALQELLGDFRRLQKPLGLALQLFHALDASDLGQAADCVEVAQRIRESQQLSVESEFHLAQALVTLEEWSRLLTLADHAISKFDHVGRFYAIRAVALDKLGLTPEALSELRKLVNTSVADQFAIDTYVNIVVRSGFIDEALELAEKLLSEASQSGRRLECLQLLYGLLRAKDPTSRRVIDAAWAMAPLVDQDDEGAEGAFLGAMLTAISSTNLELDVHVREQYQIRLSTFLDRWPESRILRRGFIPENAGIAELLEALNSLIGQPQSRSPELQKLERQLSRGEIPFPYTWRPQLLLQNIADAGQLWELGKRSRFDAHQFQLTMVANGWEERPFNERARGIPLLDLTSLFVIQDLALFDELFELFPIVAVSQSLLLEIQEKASPISGSLAQKRYAALVDELKARFEQVQQPISRLPGTETGPKAHLLSEEYIALLEDGRYFLYSDDAAFRLYATKGDNEVDGFCTLDLLNHAEGTKLLSLKEVSEKIGQLCVWKVGVSMSPRHYLGSLPDEVPSARSVSDAVDAIRKSPTCTAIFEGIWSVRKNYAEVANLVGSLLATLAKDGRNNIQSVAAIVGVWYGRAKLRTEAQALTPVERLAMLIAQTAVQGEVQTVEGIKRLWDIFGRIVEMEYGDRMDEARERESIETMGTMCARLDLAARDDYEGTPYHDALVKVLQPGLSDGDRFASAYLQEATIRNK
jgi:tetratricopeptide (TPR) repeat protein